MRMRAFGGTGLPVSEIGFGCWGLGGGWWQGTDAAECERALDLAVELGVNFFDTAYVYGDDGSSEKMVGDLVRRHPGRALKVASKIPPKNFTWPAPHGTPLREMFPRDHIRACTETTLRRLGADSLFLHQLHVFASNWVDEPEWVEELEKLRSEGKVQHWGVSINDHDPTSAVELVRRRMVDAVQVIYNLFDQSPEDVLLPACAENGVAVIVRVPFDEGGLTGSLTPSTTFPEGDFRGRYFRGDRLGETIARVEAIRSDLPDGVPVWQGALQYVLAHPAVTTVIPGMRRVENVRRNVGAAAAPPLSAATLDRLKKHRWVRDFYRDPV